MTIAAGERIPDATLIEPTSDGPAKVATGDLFKGRRVVVIGVPGAFTPTCHGNHLPGYLEHRDSFTEKGVDEVAVVSVNDVHVMKAWSEASKADGRVRFLADGNGDFARALGMDIDLGIAGMGTRSRRYSMLVEDGVVRQLNVEDSPGKADTSGAARMLESL